MTTFTNPCIRCGKERIESASWKEQVGLSLITYIMHVCPDSECQKIVEVQLKERKDYIDTIQANSLKRRSENRRNRKFPKKVN